MQSLLDRFIASFVKSFTPVPLDFGSFIGGVGLGALVASALIGEYPGLKFEMLLAGFLCIAISGAMRKWRKDHPKQPEQDAAQ